MLAKAVKTMLDRGPPPGFIGQFKKSGIVRKNESEFRRYELGAYHKKKEFRRKIANMYVPVLESHLEASNGSYPVFKVSQNAFDSLVKKATGSSSSVQRPKKLK